tara:strand:- start:10193 stop:10342 length:150 start_codon:yes stop_codon:yes gene_type:complete
MLHNVSNGWFGKAATQNLSSRPKAGQGRKRFGIIIEKKSWIQLLPLSQT